MSEEFQIELGQSVRRHAERKNSPANDRAYFAAPVGDPDEDQIPIFIAESVLRDIEEHAERDVHKEIGGVLLGGFFRTDRGAFVEITGHIEASEAKGTDISVTFTHETWQQMLTEHHIRGGDSQIIGWYHSHPALGIFLSADDEFIHTNYFQEPWHVALVIDPVTRRVGCFKKSDGKLAETEGFYIFAERIDARVVKELAQTLDANRPGHTHAQNKVTVRTTVSSSSNTGLWIAVVMLILAQMASGVYLYLNRNVKPPKPRGSFERAIKLLSISDTTGGEQYLKAELVEHPENQEAYREYKRLGEVMSDARISADRERLDRENFMLYVADLLARRKVSYQRESDLKGLVKTQETKLSFRPAGDDPVKRALQVYRALASSRAKRLRRALAIQTLMRARSAGVTYSKLRRQWYDQAVKWIEQERLREIAYGMHEIDSDYAEPFAKLSQAEQAMVKKIRSKLMK